MKSDTTSSGRPLWEGHRERLRRRMEREGWEALRPHEMVELVLFRAVPRQDVSDVSRLLVDRFGTVGGVFSASREQLLAVPGMTPNLAEWIGLTGELMRAYRDMQGRGVVRLSCCQELLAYVGSMVDQRGDARLWAIYSDFNFNMITYSDIRKGKSWWDAANVRRMVVDAIGNGARYVYMVIWTEDEPLPLEGEDIARLESIATVLRGVELDLVDCLIVGRENMLSMNAEGKMERIRSESGCMALHERYVAPDLPEIDRSGQSNACRSVFPTHIGPSSRAQ